MKIQPRYEIAEIVDGLSVGDSVAVLYEIAGDTARDAGEVIRLAYPYDATLDRTRTVVVIRQSTGVELSIELSQIWAIEKREPKMKTTLEGTPLRGIGTIRDDSDLYSTDVAEIVRKIRETGVADRDATVTVRMTPDGTAHAWWSLPV